MSNVKISPKGKALIKRKYSASQIVRAIATRGDQLYSNEGLTVTINGKTLKLKAALPNS